MPYNTLDELPEPVREALPVEAQHVWMAIFNKAWYGDCNRDDSCASKIAWAGVKKTYSKGDDGKWQKIANKDVIISNAEKITRPHDAILQVLDRKSNGIHFFNSDSFRRTVDQWNGVPIILANRHPDPEDYDLVESDPYAAAEKINGRVVGFVANPSINDNGSRPLLMGQMIPTDGEDLAGLALSTGFRCKSDSNFKLTGDVAPNHILVFPEDEYNQPRDKGAMILNKEPLEEDTMTENKELIEKVAIANKEVDNLNDKLATVNKELEEKTDTIANMESEHAEVIANKDTEIKELKDQLAVFQQKEKDTKWDVISNKIKPGILKEKGEELRKEFEEDPTTFAMKLPEYLANADTKKEEGEEFANKNDETFEAIDELKESTGRV